MIALLKKRVARHLRRAAMVRAIQAAAEPSEIWGAASMTDGLRAIRALEALNGHPFNPLDPVLVNVVRGQGPKQHHIRASARATFAA